MGDDTAFVNGNSRVRVIKNKVFDKCGTPGGYFVCKNKFNFLLFIAFHPFLVKWEDDMWYRCMIYDFKTESKMVSVFFVDYGNMQDCRVTDLRQSYINQVG